jgi:dTDP-glucose 4,6-dehydratase
MVGKMMHTNSVLPINDLESITNVVSGLGSEFYKSKVLIYGGTGFIGSWITEGLIHADTALGIDLTITLVTRNVKFAKTNFSHLNTAKIEFIEHDFSKSQLQENFEFDYVFHGATPTRALTGSGDEALTVKAAVNAAKHAIRTQSNKFNLSRNIHLSSGVIYGKQPLIMKNRLESDFAEVNTGVYSEAKIQVDQIFKSAYDAGKIFYQSPRLFAFAGPRLQLDAHFAAGNFLADGLLGRKIQIKGNPRTIRSYMYPSDLVGALLTVATQERYQDFNIGSEEGITMFELANLISNMTTNSGIELVDAEALISNYVPAITNLKAIMPRFEPMGVKQSIGKWIDWIEATNQLTKGG